MATNLRLATLNCENLFSRPKIFDENKADSQKLLEYAAKLQEALKKDIFDQDLIKDLKKKLSGYVIVNDIRGKHTAKGKGAREWVGTLDFVRSTFKGPAIENTARVISDVNADIICLIEVENRSLLEKFHNEILYKNFLQAAGVPAYKHIMLIDGNDDRGIDVSFLSRQKVLGLQSHVHERTMYMGREVPTFSRDCLEVQLEALDGKPLHLLINHFKSMGYSSKEDPQSNQRRLGQAQRVVELVDRYDLNQDYVVVAGDLNSDPASPSLGPLVNKSGLYNVNLELDSSERGTYQTGNKQIDFIFVSKALKQHLKSVSIERRGVFTKTKWECYDTVTSKETSASDHAAVAAEFRF